METLIARNAQRSNMQTNDDLIQRFGLAKKLSDILKAAKLIYGSEWKQKKKETVEIIDAYKLGREKETRLGAAIEMASALGDQRSIILLLAAAVDED